MKARPATCGMLRAEFRDCFEHVWEKIDSKGWSPVCSKPRTRVNAIPSNLDEFSYEERGVMDAGIDISAILHNLDEFS